MGAARKLTPQKYLCVQDSYIIHYSWSSLTVKMTKETEKKQSKKAAVFKTKKIGYSSKNTLQ